MMLFSNRKVSDTSSLKPEKHESNKIDNFYHALVHTWLNFWRFSRYYAEYKARIRED